VTNRAYRVGVVFPASADASALPAFAVRIEELGFDTVAISIAATAGLMCADAVRQLAVAGADTIVLAAPEDELEGHLERFARNVMPLLRPVS
jgi:NADPH-dependent ferric siderophore reductase